MRESEWRRTEETWAAWSTEELEAELNELMGEMADVRGQIEKAKAAGGADKLWLARAKNAARYKGAEHQRLLRFIASRKAAERANNHRSYTAKRNAERKWADHFAIVAKHRLPPDQYEALLQEAQKRMEDAQDAWAAESLKRA